MLVFGDHGRTERPREVLDRIGRRLDHVDAARPGIGRHAELVSVLIEVGELAQGILDASLAAQGSDGHDSAGRACMALALDLARSVWISHRSRLERFSAPGRGGLHALRAEALPEAIRMKAPEGYAFYCLYPELYGEAAQALAGQGNQLRVIGIRSIGTSLAPMVAAAVGSTRLPVALRPVGDPSARTLRLAPSLGAALAGGSEVRFAVADEGPGLSGSSFAAVARFLQGRGVSLDRIDFFPGHLGGPGPMASDETRALWEGVRKHAVSFDAVFLVRSGPNTLLRWAEDAIGRAEAVVEDLSAGAWRAHLLGDPDRWPGVNIHQERRKLLFRAGGRPWLAKFVGLGRYGERAFDRARALASAGFTPEVAAFRYGFLFQRWHPEARPLPVAGPLDRARLLERVAAYLAFRVERFPARPDDGASARVLFEMAWTNAAEGLGADAVRALDRIGSGDLSLEVKRIETDNQLHAWEWLVLPGGEILKADAVDHCAGHDLVGCQDVAWDVAGARVELGLTQDEERWLAAQLEARTGVALPPGKRRVFEVCYLAFRLGQTSLAAAGLAGPFPEEAARLDARAERYRELLRERLGMGEGPRDDPNRAPEAPPNLS
jgi:hypothetical protein